MRLDNRTAILLGGIALVGAALYYAISKIKAGVDKASDLIAAPIADAIIAITVPPTQRVNASVRLPNGSVIPFDGIRLKGDMTFLYGLSNYRVTHRGSDNIYVAVAA